MHQIAHNIDTGKRSEDITIKEDNPFQKMALKNCVLKGLEKSGFVFPTDTQATAIPCGTSGMDLMIQSKAGTGKTVIFCTILLELYKEHIDDPQSLILVPTREIAVQIDEILNKMGKFSQGFRTVCLIGGLEFSGDRKKIQGAKSIVGTPGRILHLIQNNILNARQINLLILDEADKMMSTTFEGDLGKIQMLLPSNKQMICTSATFCDNLKKKLLSFMKNPLVISCDEPAAPVVAVRQFIYQLPEEQNSMMVMLAKLKAVKYIYRKVQFRQCLIFVCSHSRARSYRNMLNKDDWPCEVLSGIQDQKTRLEIFKKFKSFQLNILISTDLMARGIDSHNVDLVINMELPEEGATYLHRIGRAGRFGSRGVAITLCSGTTDREKFINLLDKIDAGMKIMKFPEDLNLKNPTNKNESLETHIESADNINEDLIKHSEKTAVDKLHNSQTYKIEDEQYDNKVRLIETMSSLKQPSSSSNTIDDASSIAVDSDIILQSDEIDYLYPSFLELLIDASKSCSKNERGDLFEQYQNTLVNNSKSCNNLKNLLLDNMENKMLDKKLRNVFEQYEKTANGENNSQQIETLNSQEPTTSFQESYDKMLLDHDFGTINSVDQNQLTSLCYVASPPFSIYDSTNNSDESLPTISSTSFFNSSSGFDENITSGHSSEIQTSQSNDANDNSESENDSNRLDDSEKYSESSDEEYSENDSEENYFDSSSECSGEEDEKNVDEEQYNYSNEEDDKDSKDEYDSDESEKFNQLRNDLNHLQIDASARWIALYWHQVKEIHNYAKFQSYIHK